MKKPIISAVVVFMCCFTQSVHAGKELGNGGSRTALEFYDIFEKVLVDIQLESAKYPELADIHLDAIIKDTSLMISDKPLFVFYNGIRQESTAVNYKNPRRLIIHQESWNELSEKEKKVLAFHEVLSLAGLEKTGDYSISQRYYSQNQVSLYNCYASAMNAQGLSFILSEDSSTKGVYIDTPFTAQGLERFYIRMGPGTLDHSKDNSDSVYIFVDRLRKKSEIWDTLNTITFFGDPKLPRKFQMELNPIDAASSDLTLTCSLKN